MPELKPWQELPVGGTVLRDDAAQPETGGWRTGVKPRADVPTSASLRSRMVIRFLTML